MDKSGLSTYPPTLLLLLLSTKNKLIIYAIYKIIDLKIAKIYNENKERWQV